MASLRDIRRRIRSVVSIKQITRAMEMVATTKLRRFQGRAVASRPFTQQLGSTVGRLAAASPEGSSPLLARPDDGAKGGRGAAPIGLLVVTSDRGLCGAYNTNVLLAFRRFLQERGIDLARTGAYRLYVVGRKGYTAFTKRGWPVARYFAQPPLEKMSYQDARAVTKQLVDDFAAGVVSEVVVFSTRFESVVTYKPAATRLLPLVPPKGAEGESLDAIVEPDAPALLARLLPRYLEVLLWNLLLESIASEYASRRVSMKNATDAAEEIRGGLLRTYNRMRQENITKQLLEIVGGAEALR